MTAFPPFRLDTINHCLWRVADDGSTEPVGLTPRTFDVLRYLAEHPARLVTHEELLEALWADVPVQPEVLKGHVLAIRNALGDDAQSPRYIETLRGRGYRFIAEITDNGAKSSLMPGRDSGLLAGREAELARLDQAFARATSRQPQVVFVTGEPGIGKTSLVEAFFALHAGQQHVRCTYGRCIEGFGGMEPYYPVIEAISRLIKGPMGEAVVDLLISVAPAWAAQLPGLLSRDRWTQLQRRINTSARNRMIGEFCELVESLAGDDLFLLSLEDLHWADYSTIDLISAVARRRSCAKIMIVATYRPEDADMDRPSLRNLKNELSLHDLCIEIPLKPLSKHVVATFLGADLHPQTLPFAQKIHEHSGGNPLFMTALLKHLQQAKVVDHKGGKWDVSIPISDLDFQVPESLTNVIEAKIKRLSSGRQQALEAASAVGETFNCLAPAAAIGISSHEFEDICEELARRESFIRRRDIEVLPNGASVRQYGFTHALYRRVLLERQGPIRLAQTHTLIARELEKIYSLDPSQHVAFELCGQFASARDWKKGLSYLKLALQTAKRRFAHQDALLILERAEDMASHLPATERAQEQLSLEEDRASVYAASHDPRTKGSYERLINLATELDATDVHARALLGYGYALGWRDLKRCMEVLETAWHFADRQQDLQLRARTKISSAIWRIWVRGWDRNLALECDHLLDALGNGSDRQASAWAMVEYSMLCMVSSRYREAQDIIRVNAEVLVSADVDRPEFNVVRAIWMVRLGIPWSYMFLGEWGRSLEELTISDNLFYSNRNRYCVCALKLLRAYLCFHCLDFAGMKAICHELGYGVERRDPHHDPLLTLLLPAEIRHCALMYALADAALGNEEAAIFRFRQLESSMDQEPVILDWYWRLLTEWGLADTLLRLGRLDEAKAQVDSLIVHALETDEYTWHAMAWELSARQALAENDLPRAMSSIDSALLVAMHGNLPLAEWRVHRTAMAIYQATENHAEVERQRSLFQDAHGRLAKTLPPGHPLGATFAMALPSIPELAS